MPHEALKGICAAALATWAAGAPAQEIAEMKLGDLKAKGAVQVTGNDLKALVTGSTSVNKTRQGSTRRWANSDDGKFTASTTGAGGGGYASTGQGTWSINDRNQYCVAIEWKTTSEKWCAFVFRTPERTYTAGSATNDGAPIFDFQFTR